MLDFSRYQLIAAGVIVLAALVGTVLMAAKSGTFRPASQETEIVILDPEQVSIEESAVPETSEEPTSITIHVAGRVNAPGVYELPAESRVKDSIDAAGGPLSNADLDSINLAGKLADGQQVYIVAKGEIPPPTRSVVRGSASSGASTASAEPPSTSQSSKLTQPGQGTVNVNTAGFEELQRLPGIGPAMAQRILDYRAEHGRFNTVDELVEVKGIGPKTLEKMRPFIAL